MDARLTTLLVLGVAEAACAGPAASASPAATTLDSRTFVSASKLDRLPRVLHETPTFYPEVDRRKGIEGNVSAIVRIDETGKVFSVQILSGPSDSLKAAAKSYIEKLVFEPGQVGGRRVSFEIRYEHRFKLE